jgi:hypothetical protein
MKRLLKNFFGTPKKFLRKKTTFGEAIFLLILKELGFLLDWGL